MRFGVQFARVLMALSASTIMTSTVVAPMAFQAHAARSDQSDIGLLDTRYGPDPLVLPSTTYNENVQGSDAPDPETSDPATPGTETPGTETPGTGTPTSEPTAPEPGSSGSSDPASQKSTGLYYAPTSVELPPRPALALDRARMTAPSLIIVSLPNIRSVKFFIDGAPVALASIPPWDLYLGTHVDPSKFADGEHVIRAEVSFVSGAVGVRVATFSTLGP
ncbi:MAG: hypothetical protein WBA45_11190 [Microthrixaceae bacterium]